MNASGFVFQDHTADIQVESWGPSLEEAFSQTALSLMTIISPNLGFVNPKVEKKIKIKAEDKKALLFDFLSEFLYLFDVEELIFSKIIVKSINQVNDQYEINALVKGEKFDKSRHEIGTEVKAVTYSFMTIEEKEDNIKIRIVFDI